MSHEFLFVLQKGRTSNHPQQERVYRQHHHQGQRTSIALPTDPFNQISQSTTEEQKQKSIDALRLELENVSLVRDFFKKQTNQVKFPNFTRVHGNRMTLSR